MVTAGGPGHGRGTTSRTPTTPTRLVSLGSCLGSPTSTLSRARPRGLSLPSPMSPEERGLWSRVGTDPGDRVEGPVYPHSYSDPIDTKGWSERGGG